MSNFIIELIVKNKGKSGYRYIPLKNIVEESVPIKARKPTKAQQGRLAHEQ